MEAPRNGGKECEPQARKMSKNCVSCLIFLMLLTFLMLASCYQCASIWYLWRQDMEQAFPCNTQLHGRRELAPVGTSTGLLLEHGLHGLEHGNLQTSRGPAGAAVWMADGEHAAESCKGKMAMSKDAVKSLQPEMLRYS